MPKLYIAEKPSLGRAIADALPKPQKKDHGCIRCGNGDIVTWCIGHLLEQVEPDAYNEAYKLWCLDDLPIIPDQWKLKARTQSSKQLTVIKQLLKGSYEIVHAGDPDREGQLLVDEVLDHCRLKKEQKGQVMRLLISDLNLPAVKRALAHLRPNRDFIPLSVSALARSRADWLYGMNMSRAYTLLGQKAGYQGVLSVGRVQTPVLGLVVRRDEDIENFRSKDYFTLHALIPYSVGDETFDIKARWKPSEACKPWQDEDGRVLNRKLAENVASRIEGQPAIVTASEQKQVKQAPPLPYSLSALQIDAAKRFNMSAQRALDVCQSLYEKHKLITYPRSDCRYLPEAHRADIGDVLNAIRQNAPSLNGVVEQADQSKKSKAWNDKKVEAHHAIIPTPKKMPTSGLSGDEQKIYQLIATHYVIQFYDPAIYHESRLTFDILGGVFIASGRQRTSAGWQGVTRENKPDDGEPGLEKVPPLMKGTKLVCREGVIEDKKTEPPPHFTEATLLRAMTGIARFVADKSLKQILRDTDGLGTEATRAGILDTLFKRQLLVREGKQVRSSGAGRALIHALPDIATFPDMTAHWEHQLQAIAEKHFSYQPFMDELTTNIHYLMDNVKQGPVPDSLRNMAAVSPGPSKKKRRVYRQKRRSST